MDELARDVTPGARWNDRFADALAAQRGQVEAFAAAQREEMARIEALLAEQLERLASELAADRQQADEGLAELAAREADCTQRAAELSACLSANERREADLLAWQARIEALELQHTERSTDAEREWTRQLAARDEQITDLRAREAAVAQQRDVLIGERDALSQHRDALAQAVEALQLALAEAQQLSAERQDAAEQRAAELVSSRAELASSQFELSELRRVAQALETQRTSDAEGWAAREAELRQALEGAELRAAQMAMRVEETENLAAACSQLTEALRSEKQQTAALSAERDRAQQRITELQRGVDQLRAELASLEQRLMLSAARQTLAGPDPRVTALETECETLRRLLADAEERAEQATTRAGEKPAHDDWERRYQMALADAREQRQLVSELQRKLEAAQKSTPTVAPTTDGMDWESQKRRMLAALESDFDESSPETARDRLTVQEAIRRTEAAVAARDREIAELRQHLEQQSSNVGSVAVGAAAIGQLLDSDEIVRQERDSLKQLQDEWRNKLRTAEIDLSIERAKIARERVQLEERLQVFERQQAERQAQDDAAPAGGAGNANKKPTRGRWLARLGLQDDDAT